MDDLQFLHFDHMPACRARVDKRFDGYCSFQYMSSGRLQLAYDHRQYDLDGSWAWPAWPGPRIRFQALAPAGSWHHRYCAFRGPRVAAWRAAGVWPDAPQAVPEQAGLAADFDRLHQLLRQGTHWAQLRAINLLEGMLLQLADWRQAGRERDAWLRVALARLDACPDGMPPVATIAADCGLSTVALRRRFLRAMGCSPRSYLQQRRLARARDLLARGDQGLEQVAAQLGYTDAAHFSRQFKHYTGVSPGRYRSSCQVQRPPA